MRHSPAPTRKLFITNTQRAPGQPDDQNCSPIHVRYQLGRSQRKQTPRKLLRRYDSCKTGRKSEQRATQSAAVPQILPKLEETSTTLPRFNDVWNDSAGLLRIESRRIRQSERPCRTRRPNWVGFLKFGSFTPLRSAPACLKLNPANELRGGSNSVKLGSRGEFDGLSFDPWL
jgi:hypothetical protein